MIWPVWVDKLSCRLWLLTIPKPTSTSLMSNQEPLICSGPISRIQSPSSLTTRALWQSNSTRLNLLAIGLISRSALSQHLQLICSCRLRSQFLQKPTTAMSSYLGRRKYYCQHLKHKLHYHLNTQEISFLRHSTFLWLCNPNIPFTTTLHPKIFIFTSTQAKPIIHCLLSWVSGPDTTTATSLVKLTVLLKI